MKGIADMLFEKEEFIGKNGKTYILRSPDPADAEKMLHYLKTTARETEYGLSYPEELNFSIQDEENFINSFSADKSSIMIAAFDGDSLVGYANLGCDLDKMKTSHRATFGIAVVKSAWGQGLGYEIMSGLIAFAKRAGFEQIELEVVSSNVAAVNLYKKLGFEVYGERPRSLKLKDGTYFDELLMVLNLRA